MVRFSRTSKMPATKGRPARTRRARGGLVEGGRPSLGTMSGEEKRKKKKKKLVHREKERRRDKI